MDKPFSMDEEFANLDKRHTVEEVFEGFVNTLTGPATIENEMETVRHMIDRAVEAGVLNEVVQWFGMYRANGDSVAVAACDALHEWDA